MQKNFLFFIMIFGSLAGCSGPDQKGEETTVVNMTSGTSNNPDAFNESFQKLLTTYYSLKDAFIEYDTSQANAAARNLSIHADSLPIAAINDSTGAIKETAKNLTGTISGSALGLVGETDLEKKKKEFQMISDAMYDLVRTVKYDQQKIYHQHCPMAFGEEAAYWISTSPEIINPYLGKQHPKYKAGMLHCGDITDSLDFSK